MKKLGLIFCLMLLSVGLFAEENQRRGYKEAYETLMEEHKELIESNKNLRVKYLESCENAALHYENAKEYYADAHMFLEWKIDLATALNGVLDILDKNNTNEKLKRLIDQYMITVEDFERK